MTIVLFLALVWKFVDFLRELTDVKANRSGLLTQLTAWAGGVIIIALAAHSGIAQDLILPGTETPMGDLDVGSIILAGLLVASGASSAVDIKQAIDTSDSAAKPPLFDDSQRK